MTIPKPMAVQRRSPISVFLETAVDVAEDVIESYVEDKVGKPFKRFQNALEKSKGRPTKKVMKRRVASSAR